MTSLSVESFREDAAASPGGGPGLASAQGLPGEAGDGGRGRRIKVGGPGGFSLIPAHCLQGLNALAEEAVQPAEKPEPLASAGEVTGHPRKGGDWEL